MSARELIADANVDILEAVGEPVTFLWEGGGSHPAEVEGFASVDEAFSQVGAEVELSVSEMPVETDEAYLPAVSKQLIKKHLSLVLKDRGDRIVNVNDVRPLGAGGVLLICEGR